MPRVHPGGSLHLSFLPSLRHSVSVSTMKTLVQAGLDGRVPVTAPCGFVCLLPGAKPQITARWTSLWTTDGDTLQKGGKTYSLADARMALTAELTGSAQKFPLRVEGRVFHQIIEQDAKHYVLVLLDAGWRFPVARCVLHSN